MKTRLFAFSLLLFLLLATAVDSQAQKKYGYGYRQSETLTSALTVSVTPANTYTLYILAADTNVTVNAVTSKAVIGDRVCFRITGNTRTRTIVFGTNLEGANGSVASTKVITYEFVFTGTSYDIVSIGTTN